MTTTATPGMYPDVEGILCDLLGAFGTSGTVTPADLQQHLPFHRVVRFAGADDFVTDTARVDVDTFAGTREQAYLIAEVIRQYLVTQAPIVTPGAVIDRVTTTSAPVETPWGDPGIRRRTATYTVTTRRVT